MTEISGVSGKIVRTGKAGSAKAPTISYGVFKPVIQSAVWDRARERWSCAQRCFTGRRVDLRKYGSSPDAPSCTQSSGSREARQYHSIPDFTQA